MKIYLVEQVPPLSVGPPQILLATTDEIQALRLANEHIMRKVRPVELEGEVAPWAKKGAETLAYPYPEGETLVLGPEIFAAEDGSVICWKGVNYTPQPDLLYAMVKAAAFRDVLDEMDRLERGGTDGEADEVAAQEAAR